ncbi:hypothetical protein SAMN04515674_106127 [Pseudarcicella hirudinis]|uniref:SGNH/GDSL hydrolase family protein n=1 Tax=Pseudarcicella hirudinis TaxID=1079859 RepID=A0A1I5TNF5_9BACT|nr:hypothetical protein [Pseudarcicella hirudinis]SFP84612.1 hypothetical protein SAMN04515674_106127 [Pseudarcicella hirudinis]
MKILVIGGCHSYGYGIAAGQGFVQRIVNRLEKEYGMVKVDYYTPFKMAKTVLLLNELKEKTRNYDLILLQLGHFELLQADSFKSLIASKNRDFNQRVYGTYDQEIELQNKPTDLTQFLTQGFDQVSSKRENRFTSGLKKMRGKSIDLLKFSILKTLNLFMELPRIQFVRINLTLILDSLYQVRDKVLLLTPFPIRERTSNFLRKEGQKIFLEEGLKRGFNVIDSFEIISGNKENCFLEDGCHLNARGHRAIFKEIMENFDFYETENTNLLNVRKIFRYFMENQN